MGVSTICMKRAESTNQANMPAAQSTPRVLPAQAEHAQWHERHAHFGFDVEEQQEQGHGRAQQS